MHHLSGGLGKQKMASALALLTNAFGADRLRQLHFKRPTVRFGWMLLDATLDADPPFSDAVTFNVFNR